MAMANNFSFLNRDKKTITVDLKNPRSLYKFFSDFNHLTDRELASALKIKISRVRRLKRISGHKCKEYPYKSRYGLAKPVYDLHPETCWDNSIWFRRMRNYGIDRLAKMLKIGVGQVLERFEKYNTPSRHTFNPPKHPCNKYEWIFHHYWVLKLSISKCSIIADVAKSTFSDWMSQHHIPLRKNKKRSKKPSRLQLYQLLNTIGQDDQRDDTTGGDQFPF